MEFTRMVRLGLLAAVLLRPGGDAVAASLATECRHACKDTIAACVETGMPPGKCRRATLRQCRREGLSVCIPTGEGPVGSASALTGSGLQAPASLVATTSSSNAINLAWVDTNSREIGSYVERSTSATSGFALVATLSNNVNTYRDGGLAPATTYYYRVRAYGRKGATSPYSNVAGATTFALTDTTPPSVPTGLTASPVTCSQVNLSWTASTDTGGSGLKGYNIYRWINSTQTLLKQVLAPSTSTSDTGLLASSTYSYTVAAVDNAGNVSTVATWVAATTPACSDTSPPSVPTGLSVLPMSCSALSVAWNASIDNGGAGLLGYKVYRNNVFLRQVSAPTTAMTDSGLAQTTVYSYAVSAVDNAGNESARSTSASATTSACATTTTASTTTSTTTSSTAPTTTTTAPATTSTSTTPTTSTSTTSTTRTTTTTTSSSSTTTSTTSSTTTTTVNQPPVANAGPDQFTQTLTAITFTGSGSYDPDGTIAAYGWAFGDGTTGSGMTVTHSYATAGSYTATLTVTDNRGLTARDTAAVSITNRAPVANAGADQTAAPGAVVSFSGAGSADPDGTIASYTWSFGDGATGSGVTTNHAYATAGTYTARLTVTDNLGATGTDTATITVAATSAGGTYVWAKTFGSAGDDRGQGVAADRNGNVFMTGAFTGTVDFGTGPLTSTHFSYLNATDYKDIVIAKYAPSGAAVWVRQIGAESNDGGNAIAVDGNGDVVVTGYCSNAVDFGNGVLTTSGGDYDIFVAKYSGVDGRYLWAKRFATAASEYGYGIAVDANGNVFATGVFYGTLDFGTGALTSSGGSADVWLAKYSPTGTPLWAKQIGGTGTDFGYGVAVDPSGNPVLVGRMSGTVSLGGGALTSAGGYDVFLAKYAAADGHYLWGKVFGGTGDDYGDAVAVDGSGDVYVTGNFPGTINFGDGGVTSAGSTDGYVAKYAGTDGHYLWAKPLGGTGGDAGSGVAVDGQQNVIVTGYFSGVVNFGTGSLASAGATDGFAVKYTSAGTPLWSKRFGGTATDFATRAATDAGGDVNVIGSYSGTSDFGGGPIPSAGGFDLFLLRLAP